MVTDTIKVLLIEDNPGDADLIRLMLDEACAQGAGDLAFDLTHTEYLGQAILGLAEQRYDIVLVDLTLPDSQGLDTVVRLCGAVPELPVVVLSGLADEAVAVQAVQIGAQDYLVKGHIDAHLISRAIRYAIERKHAQEEVRRLNQELEQRVIRRTAELEAANKELEAFSYSVSHDLRAPLRAIDGFSRIVLEEYAPQLPNDAQRYLGMVRSNAQRMGQLIDDLLAFSRLNRQALDMRTVAPSALVRQVLEELRAEHEGRNIEIRIGNLPECRADPSLLKQVWVNLLSNALKYTRHREAAKIEIGSRSSDGVPVYFVRDNGAGFDMRYADRLFGVFQRLHRTEDYEGTGVGLALVQRIVHRHGGRVWAEAEVDRGATFYFTVGKASP